MGAIGTQGHQGHDHILSLLQEQLLVARYGQADETSYQGL